MVDIPGDSTTGSRVTLGGTVQGELEANGDHDWFRLQLDTTRQITILVTGLTLEDPYLRIRDSAGNIVFESDDINPGIIRDSRVSFTAQAGETYFVDVGAWDEGYAGTYEVSVQPYTPPPEWSIGQVADFLSAGFWAGDSHHFDVTQGGTVSVNLSALTSGGQFLAREALSLWSDVIGVKFVEVTTGGQIVFDDNEEGAFADGVWSNGITTSATVNVSTQWLSDYGTAIDSYAFQTYVHETGHALGLGHAGYYNGTADYFSEAVFANDGWPMTVMSYFSQNESNYFRDLDFDVALAATPMMGDIAAMQELYGLSTTTRTGDTTYGFNSNAGRVQFNASAHSDLAYTVFDSSGVDTLDYSGFSAAQVIDLTEGRFSDVGGLTGNVAIALGTIIENATGGSGYDQIFGNSANNRLNGGGSGDHIDGFDGSDELLGGAGDDHLDGGNGADVLVGGAGTDMLTGGSGDDVFRFLANELSSGDSVRDFQLGDSIVISNANLSTFAYSVFGNTLTTSVGTLSVFGWGPLEFVASAAAEGGVQLTLANNPPPPPPPPVGVSRAKLILTQAGQDLTVGGNVAVLGTSAPGEVIEIVRGDVTLDASFNAGGDTVVLPGSAGSYTAVLTGSFVTIEGGDLSVAIPVGTSGIGVQFADSTRTLGIESGQVRLGSQQVTSIEQSVAASGAALVDPAETGPDSFAKLILTAPGQDVDIGGNVSVTGTSASGEVISVLDGNVRLDASFNAGGDTVMLSGPASSYTATLSGSFVTIADGETSVAIPVGINGLTVDFSDADRTLRIDTASGQVMLGGQVITATEQPVAQGVPTMEALFTDKDGNGGDVFAIGLDAVEVQAHLEIDSFHFG
jgi:Ca2+-binding RTX toxin-like protein